jgi:hypothetical protein
LFSPRAGMFPRDPFSTFGSPPVVADPRSPPTKGEAPIIRSIDDLLWWSLTSLFFKVAWAALSSERKHDDYLRSNFLLSTSHSLFNKVNTAFQGVLAIRRTYNCTWSDPRSRTVSWPAARRYANNKYIFFVTRLFQSLPPQSSNTNIRFIFNYQQCTAHGVEWFHDDLV